VSFQVGKHQRKLLMPFAQRDFIHPQAAYQASAMLLLGTFRPALEDQLDCLRMQSFPFVPSNSKSKNWGDKNGELW
jgi:hypothetical protein